MGNEYGRQVFATVGHSIKVTADGEPEAKIGGVTIDWATVAAAGAPATLEDGVVIETGDKYLRYGQFLAKITASGLYGPYDPGAADGRQTITKGEFFIVNGTVKEADSKSNHPEAIFGGLVFKDRLIATAGAASLAAGPTFANVEANLPRLVYVLNS